MNSSGRPKIVKSPFWWRDKVLDWESVAEKVLFFLIPILSAILLATCFPGYSYCYLAWFCLAPLLYVLRQKGIVTAGIVGFLFGVSFSLSGFGWLVTLDTVGYLQWLFLFIPLFSLYFLIFGVAYNFCARNIGGWILLAGPSLWVGLEYIRSNLSFLTSPMNLLGHSQYTVPWVIQLSDITGVYGVSFFIMLINQYISEIPEIIADHKHSRYKWKKYPFSSKYAGQFLIICLVLAAALAYGYRTGSFDEQKAENINVALIQGNILTKDNMSYKEQVQHLHVYRKMTYKTLENKPDLIIWPASSLPAPIHYSRLVASNLKKIARETDAYLLVGGAGYEKFTEVKKGSLPFSNSEFLISPTGKIVGQYNKMKLLPFNEYLPLQGKITWPRWITSLNESFLAGTEYTLFRVYGATFGAPICWENYLSDHFRQFVKNGANFMVSATNDAFFGLTDGPYQALAINVFRAVENRVPIARVSATGITCFIHPNGNISNRVHDSSGQDLHVPGLIISKVPLYNRKSIYTQYGDVFSYAVIAAALFCLLFSLCISRVKHR